VYKLEFGIVHRGCLVNELSRAFPKIRLICPGGFILSPSSVEEVFVLDSATEQDLALVVDHLRKSPGITEVKVLVTGHGFSGKMVLRQGLESVMKVAWRDGSRKTKFVG